MDALYPPGSGVIAPELLKTLSGLEFMQRLVSGEMPQPPIAGTIGFSFASARRGEAVVVSRPGTHVYNPMGMIHGGYAATLLDTCMGCAVMTQLAAGMGYTTVEIKVNYLRKLTHESGELRATGCTLHVGRSTALAEGRLVDPAGRLVAHGSCTCLVFPL